MSRFIGKTVLVSGAGTGLGRAAALAFAAEGADVVLSGRRAATLADTAAAIESAGGKAFVATADVSVEDDVRGLVDTVVQRFGRLDVAFNNAGMLTSGPVVDLDLDAVNQMLSINVAGTWLAMKYQLRQMVEQGGGAIVNMASSVGAHVVLPNAVLYGATKAAVLALSRGVALEHAANNIRVNVVSPGAVDGPMSIHAGETAQERDLRVGNTAPVGRIGRADEIADAVLWLASDQASYVTGQDIVLDGGSSL